MIDEKKELNKTFEIINVVVVIFLTLPLTMLSAFFFIGDQISFDKMINELPWSFVYRFSAFAFLGFIGITILFLINLVLNKTLLKNLEKINLVKMSLICSGIVVTGCLIGTSIFFSL